MPLTSRSWVQITASFNNSALLAQQIKSVTLRKESSNMFAFRGEINIVDKTYLGLGAL